MLPSAEYDTLIIGLNSAVRNAVALVDLRISAFSFLRKPYA